MTAMAAAVFTGDKRHGNRRVVPMDSHDLVKPVACPLRQLVLPHQAFGPSRCGQGVCGINAISSRTRARAGG
jgi:hypothetical protein